MRLSLPGLIFFVLATGVAMCAHAGSGDRNRYKWRDAAGNLQYSDSLPAEAAKYGYEVVGPQGIVIKRVERAKTAAELAAAKVSAATAQVQQNKIAADERADEQLISGYPEESDLKRTQQQKLEMLDQQIVAAQISLRSQEQALADLLGRAADEERNKKTLSDFQARQLAKMRKQVDDQRLTVERRRSERQNAVGAFDAEIARYRELKAKLAAPQSGQ
ncbi:MAG: DUF4124 domain-containing protein [Dokdonella sp.]